MTQPRSSRLSWRRHKWAAVAAVVLAVISCSESSGGAIPNELPPTPVRVDGDCRGEVRFADAELARSLTVSSTPIAAGDHGELRVELLVRARLPLRVGVSVDFRDACGVPYGDRSTRRVLVLGAGETGRVSVVSARCRARRYLVRIDRR